MYQSQQTTAPARPQTKAELVVEIPPTPTMPMPPGYTMQPGFGQNGSGMPPEVRDISVAFFLMCAVMVIGWPIARALGKRLERRPDLPAVNPAISDQLVRIEQAVDAMSVEIERISESQRFLAKLQSGQGAVPVERR